MIVTPQTRVRVRCGDDVIIDGATLDAIFSFRGLGSNARRRIEAELEDGGKALITEKGPGYTVEVIA